MCSNTCTSRLLSNMESQRYPYGTLFSRRSRTKMVGRRTDIVGGTLLTRNLRPLNFQCAHGTHMRIGTCHTENMIYNFYIENCAGCSRLPNYKKNMAYTNTIYVATSATGEIYFLLLRYFIGTNPSLATTDPELIQQVFITNFKHFPVRAVSK